MKKHPLLITALGFVTLSVSSLTYAASAGTGPKAKIFAEFDTNKNGVIDGDEVAAVRKAFAADPKGQFAGYDIDHDGKLSDAEVALIKPPGARKNSEKKAGKKKSEATSDATKTEDKPDVK